MKHRSFPTSGLGSFGRRAPVRPACCVAITNAHVQCGRCLRHAHAGPSTRLSASRHAPMAGARTSVHARGNAALRGASPGGFRRRSPRCLARWTCSSPDVSLDRRLAFAGRPDWPVSRVITLRHFAFLVIAVLHRLGMPALFVDVGHGLPRSTLPIILQ
jgi:hypothetical protein